MSPSKASQIVFDQFYNIVDGKQRSSLTFYNGIDPTTQQKNWDVSNNSWKNRLQDSPSAFADKPAENIAECSQNA